MTPEDLMARQIKRLQDNLVATLDLIGDLRYRDWPPAAAEALGLDAEAMDLVMQEGEKALAYSKRRPNRDRR